MSQKHYVYKALNLTDLDLIFSTVVKFGSLGRLMRSHSAAHAEPALILQIHRHTGRARQV